MKRTIEERRKKRKGKKKGGVISTVILILAIIIFCISAYKLFTIFQGYHKGDQEYDHLKDIGIDRKSVV